MRYILVIFLPFVYLGMRKKWLSAIVSGILFLVSLPLWMTIIGGALCWFFAVAPAAWELHIEMAEIQATKIAEKMKR